MRVGIFTAGWWNQRPQCDLTQGFETKTSLAIAARIMQGCGFGLSGSSMAKTAGGLSPGRKAMKRFFDFFWPAVGVLAVAVSLWLLRREFEGEAVGPEVWEHFKSIPQGHTFLAILSTLVAYAALAWYDRIALLHLRVKHISWIFISLCSFTTYALAHNIGATVFSGGMVRYRAYHTKGLSAAQVALLVAVCSLTFALGTVLLGGIISVLEPEQLSRFRGLLPEKLRFLTDRRAAQLVGVVLLSGVAIYVIGSIFKFKPMIIKGFRLEYPAFGIVLRQLVAAPLELLGAAGIIYFALPDAGNPGYFAVLAVFIFSFSAALWSNAPGGLGVFEWFFITAMPEMPNTQVLAALLAFRFSYLIVPFFLSIFVVIAFERNRLKETLHHEERRSSPGLKEAADQKQPSIL
jgi:glycosyltransferase 2 family protein